MTHPMMRMIAAYPLPSALTSGCAAAPSWRSATPSMIANTTTGNLALRHRGEGVREHVVHGDQQELESGRVCSTELELEPTAC